MSEQELVIRCATKACPASPGDLQTYNLQDALVFNGTPLSFIQECPAGYYCRPGLFPRVVTYPPGTFSVLIPPLDTGFPIVLNYHGCESDLNTILPAGSTQAQAEAAAQQLINEAAAQQARCDAKTLVGPPLPIQINLSDIYEYACVDVAAALAISGSSTPTRTPITFIVSNKPSWLTASQGATTLFMAGTPTSIGVYNFIVTATALGTPPGSGTKNYTLNVIGIETAATLPAGEVGAPYSETLDASSIPGVSIWEVTAGVLPDGLTLDTATGEISGTPTTEETEGFTISAGNGEITCSKAFTLEITDAFDCLGNAEDVQSAVWTQSGTGSQPPCGTISAAAGVGTFSIDYNISTCLDNGLSLDTTICNPTTAYDITVNVPWDDSGNVNGGFAHTITVNLFINGLSVDTDTKDLVTGPFTDFSVTGSLPQGSANTVKIQISMNAVPDPLVSAFSLGNFTITPLTHP